LTDCFVGSILFIFIYWYCCPTIFPYQMILASLNTNMICTTSGPGTHLEALSTWLVDQELIWRHWAQWTRNSSGGTEHLILTLVFSRVRFPQSSGFCVFVFFLCAIALPFYSRLPIISLVSLNFSCVFKHVKYMKTSCSLIFCQSF
jgi:hypothetical protein